MKGRGEYNSALPMTYKAEMKRSLDHVGYMILYGTADPLLSMAAVGEVDSMRSIFPGIAMNIFFEFVQSTFPAENKLKTEKERCLWNPVSTSAWTSWNIKIGIVV